MVIAARELEELAEILRLPMRSLSGVSRLAPDEIARLRDLVDGVCRRQSGAVDAALRDLLPFGDLPIRLLRRGGTP